MFIFERLILVQWQELKRVLLQRPVFMEEQLLGQQLGEQLVQVQQLVFKEGQF
jgi:hypothetical protein